MTFAGAGSDSDCNLRANARSSSSCCLRRLSSWRYSSCSSATLRFLGVDSEDDFVLDNQMDENEMYLVVVVVVTIAFSLVRSEGIGDVFVYSRFDL